MGKKRQGECHTPVTQEAVTQREPHRQRLGRLARLRSKQGTGDDGPAGSFRRLVSGKEALDPALVEPDVVKCRGTRQGGEEPGGG
jgi:hypothetical protein